MTDSYLLVIDCGTGFGHYLQWHPGPKTLEFTAAEERHATPMTLEACWLAQQGCPTPFHLPTLMVKDRLQRAPEFTAATIPVVVPVRKRA